MLKGVLLLLPGAFSGYGGIEMYNRQFIRAYLEIGLESGFEVTALVLNDRPEDVDDRYLPRGARRPKGFRASRWRFVVEALWNALRARPGLVVFGHLHLKRIAPVLRVLSPGSRHWYVVHGIEAWKPLDEGTRRELSRADRILSVSEFTKEQLLKGGGLVPGRIALLPNALDAVWQGQYEASPELPAARVEGEKRLLTVARLAASERYKGIDSVIRALPGVAKRIPEISYDVVGDGDDRPRLEALARDLRVQDRIRFRGRLSPRELAEAYRTCLVYVMPSSHEGFGIVFLEAALFGKPSIGGRHGGTPEVIEDGRTGLLVEHDDISGLEKAILNLAENEDRRLALGAGARAALLERFTYAAFRNRLLTLLGREDVAAVSQGS